MILTKSKDSVGVLILDTKSHYLISTGLGWCHLTHLQSQTYFVVLPPDHQTWIILVTSKIHSMIIKLSRLILGRQVDLAAGYLDTGVDQSQTLVH